jgi:tRNA dimethylallyltransferase
MCGVPHHLINVFEPHEKANVRIFSEMAIKCVEDLRSRSVLPIVVGGTHYYVEALLFERSCDEKDTYPDSLHKAADLSELDPYLRLKQIDPLIASTIHPNDSRRIQKALTNEVLSSTLCSLSKSQRSIDESF